VTNRLSEEQIKVLAPRLAEMMLAEKQMLHSEMGKVLGLSLHKLQTLRESETYQEIFEKLRKTREQSIQKSLKVSTLAIREKLNDYTHEAVETLYLVMKSATAKDGDRISAACEILDRDGRFAKVSRLMNVQQGQDGAPMLPEDQAAEIFDAIEVAKAIKVKETVQ
jgi:hypothetical protein